MSAAPSVHAIVTVTGSDGVIYDIVNEAAMTVKVSKTNTSKFRDITTDIVIPAQVVDQATTAVTTDPYTVVGIDTDAFKDCTGLRNVTIEAPFEEIPTRAFSGCTGIENVTLPSTVRKIQDRAFENCSSMVSISGYDYLTDIRPYAFNGCSTLAAFSFPEGLEKLGTYAFHQCASLMEVSLPSTLKLIDSHAFSECTSLQTASLAEGLETISSHAFSACTSLICPSFPSTLTEISSYAFGNCTSLGEVSLNYPVKLASNAFYKSDITALSFAQEGVTLYNNCFDEVTSLKKVTLTKGLSLIGTSFFYKCPDLAEVIVEEGVKTIPGDSFYGCTSLQKLTLPESLDEIKGGAFSDCEQLQDFRFPTSMTLIDRNAFKGCKGLQHLVLPAGVNTGEASFGSTDLLSITYPDAPIGETVHSGTFGSQHSVTALNLPGGMGRIPTSLFRGFINLEEVVIGDGIEKIGQWAFRECSSLKKVTLSGSVHTIEEGAFTGCSSLAEIELPEGLERIESSAFSGTALKEVTFPTTLRRIGNKKTGGSSHPGAFGSLPLTKVTFKEGCTFLDDCTFEGCKSLTEVHLPESMDTICRHVFSGCSSLTEISLPSKLKLVDDWAFASCALTSVTLPAGCHFVDAVFSANRSLTEIIFPNQECTFSGSDCFSQCYALTEVTLPDYMKEVNERMFNGCTKLAKVNFNAGLERILNRAFYGCSQLTSLEFPESLQSIGEYAFYGNKIDELTLPARIEVGSSAFSSCKTTMINFPEEPCTFDVQVFGSNYLLTEVSLPCWLTKVPDRMFASCSNLEKLEICEQIEEIGDEAFSSCSYLHDVDFPESIKRIGAKAFNRCGKKAGIPFGIVELNEGVELGDEAFGETTVTGLVFNGCATFGADVLKQVTTIEEIAFPSCMESIPDGFCNGWTNLKKVTIPATVKEIGKQCFNGCRSLTEINLPENLERIGDEAFKNAALTEVIFPDRKVSLGNSVFAQSYTQTLQRVEFSQYQDSIPYRCFEGCSKLQSAEWRKPVEGTEYPDIVIEREAFTSCRSLPIIEFPDANLQLGTAAFRYCYALEDIVWPSDKKSVQGGELMFASCTSLKNVTIPAGMQEVPARSFDSCNNIQSVTIPGTCTAIRTTAFESAGVYELTLGEGIQTLETDAFAHCKMQDLLMPASLTRFGYAFEKCPELETVAFAPNSQTEEISNGAFKSCAKLRRIEIPHGVTTINYDAFRECGALVDVEFPSTLQTIGSTAFYKCTGIEHIVFPEGFARLNEGAFDSCTGLLDVTNNSTVGVEFNGYYHFSGCSSLKKVISNGVIKTIGSCSFQNCEALEDFLYTAETPIDRFSSNCFDGCHSLKNADFFVSPTFVGKDIFRDCRSLRSITIPANLKVTPESICYGCTDLQSVVWENSGKTFGLAAAAIADAPLKALSYSWATNIDMPTSVSTACSMDAYKPKGANEQYVVTTPSASKLLVPRGERWKYIEQGYGEVFDIVEMRNPTIELTGDIFSTYDDEKNVNHYMANLRWHLPLSDLNQNGPTKVQVFRQWKDSEGDHKVKVADIEFSKPSEPHYDPNWNCGDVITVDVKYNGEDHHTFTGDFVGFDETTGKWRVEYVTQDDVLTFDAVSHKRQLTFDRYGYKSWFALSDTFDSPELVAGDVPISYTYSAVMDGFEYEVLENNEDLQPGEDGLLYHTITNSPEIIESQECVLSAALAVPTLKFNGLYTFDDILEDLAHQKDITPGHSAKRGYEINYHVDSDALMQEGYIAETRKNEFILSDIQLRQYKDGKYETVATYNFPTSASNRQPDGKISLPSTVLNSIEPGGRYIVVTHSKYRGEFGSAPLIVPDIPQMQHVEVYAQEARHPEDKDQDTTNHWVLGVMPMEFRHVSWFDLSSIGYSEGLPPEGDHYFGVWRSINTTPLVLNAPSGMRADTAADDELLHHTSGVQSDCFSESQCEHCTPSERSVSVNENGHIEYTDVADIPMGSSYDAAYRTRLYVKVPSTYLPHQESWMIAEAAGSTEKGIVSGVDNVNIDTEDESDVNIKWFDLQGRPVSQPLPGQTYIRVTPAGSATVRF